MKKSETRDYREIGERLERMRTAFTDCNQKDFAEKHGFTREAYHSWESGSRRISVDQAILLADKYGVDLDWIYRGRSDGLSEIARKVL